MADYAYRTTMEYSIPADTASGKYYWTNAYYWESDFSAPTSDPNNNRIHLAQLASVSEAVTCERWRIESAFGTGSYLADIPGPVAGQVPSTDRALIVDAVRLVSGPGSAGRWYKPLRGLLGASDVVGGIVSAYILSWLEDNVLSRLAFVPIVNYRRQPVANIQIVPTVRPWQMRHGTKRSARRVLFPR